MTRPRLETREHHWLCIEREREGEREREKKDEVSLQVNCSNHTGAVLHALITNIQTTREITVWGDHSRSLQTRKKQLPSTIQQRSSLSYDHSRNSARFQVWENEDNHHWTRTQSMGTDWREAGERSIFTTTIVDLDTVTGLRMPHSSKRISSSLSEIISKISWTIFNFCRLDMSAKRRQRNRGFHFHRDPVVLTHARRCFRQSEDPLIIVRRDRIVQIQWDQRIILNRKISIGTLCVVVVVFLLRRRQIVRWRVSVSRRWAGELAGEFVSGHSERREFSWGIRYEEEFDLQHAHLFPRGSIRLLAHPPETRREWVNGEERSTGQKIRSEP